jgi:prepilin-type N-terminal cleavage/methylation domain-containing protein
MSPLPHRRAAFTLIEMLVVMVVIAILAGIVLSIAGLVQNKAARSRAEAEIKALAGGCDAYKADNGSFPQDAPLTDSLDPRATGTPASYEAASLYLYKQISGDLDANGRNDPNASTPEPRSYLSDFFKPNNLSVNSSSVGTAGYVKFIKDPWGNSYGYSTKGAAAEQKYRVDVLTAPTVARQSGQGYNPTYDLWSTGGKTVKPNPGQPDDITPVWLKNW